MVRGGAYAPTCDGSWHPLGGGELDIRVWWKDCDPQIVCLICSAERSYGVVPLEKCDKTDVGSTATKSRPSRLTSIRTVCE
jgi:hypothetical protein